MGAATSDLTLFRQIGGTVGLTLAFTLLRGALTTAIPQQLAAAGLPAHVVNSFPESAISASELTNVNGSPAADLLAQLPAQVRPLLEPYTAQITTALHEAISAASAQSFWLSVIAAVGAVIATAFIPKLPLRQVQVTDQAGIPSTPLSVDGSLS